MATCNISVWELNDHVCLFMLKKNFYLLTYIFDYFGLIWPVFYFHSWSIPGPSKPIGTAEARQNNNINPIKPVSHLVG